MFRLLVCRHSERDTQAVNCGISENGINLIDSKIDDIKKWISEPELILTSPYRRTLETAQCIGAHFNLQQDKIKFHNLIEEVIFHEHQKEKLGEPLKRTLGWNDLRELEVWNDVFERTELFFDDIKQYSQLYDKKNLICITHGGIINSMLTVLNPSYEFDKDNTNPHTYVPQYCEFIVLEISMSSIKLIHKSF